MDLNFILYADRGYLKWNHSKNNLNKSIVHQVSRKKTSITRHHFLSFSELWSRPEGHQVRGRRHNLQPAGDSAEGGAHKTSKVEFSGRQRQQASSWCPSWRTSCLASLLCVLSLLPLDQQKGQEDARPLQNKCLVFKVTSSKFMDIYPFVLINICLIWKENYKMCHL